MKKNFHLNLTLLRNVKFKWKIFCLLLRMSKLYELFNKIVFIYIPSSSGMESSESESVPLSCFSTWGAQHSSFMLRTSVFSGILNSFCYCKEPKFFFDYSDRISFEIYYYTSNFIYLYDTHPSCFMGFNLRKFICLAQISND